MKYVLLALSLVSGALFADGLEVSAGKVRESIPGTDNSVAYFTIRNHFARDCNLSGAETEVAERAQLHGHSAHQGMMRMQSLHSLTIAPGATLSLRPGSYHLMLLGLRRPLLSGETLNIKLDFGDCGFLSSSLRVVGIDEFN